VLPVPELPPEASAADQRLGQVLRRMAGVFVFSDAYAREVVRRHDVDPARVHRAHVGCEHWSRDLQRPVEPSGVPRILVLGAIRSARDPLAVLEGFAELTRGGVQAELCFVGRPGDAAPAFRLRLEALASSVRWIDEPREEDMPELVAGSALLLHLAGDEGTPVTPLEAFAMGLDVVADPLPAFREALGDEALYCADHEPRTLARRLEEALARREDLAARDRRRARAAEYRWETTARETLAGWARVLAPGS
jgi:glycosyltransferase involved in cell wall biosynthesis